MDIKAPEKKFGNISYGDPAFKELIEYLNASKDDDVHHLCLFLGHYDPDKQEAIKQLSQEVSLSVEQINFDDIVSRSETKTFVNLDRLFDKYKSSSSILYFTNGDKLCGAYTGFTKSKVKYATPQERYFLKKVQDFKGIVIIDITEYSDADQTIRRAAQSIVKFPLPKSPVSRFLWHLKNWSPHGYDLKTKRPEVYGEAEGSVS